MATEVQISVASSNIANASTAGYTEKTANQSATVSGGAGTGTVITGITSNVDKLLMKSLVSSNSDLGSANAANNYLDQLQALYGSTTDAAGTGTSLANTLATLESSISALSDTSGSSALQASTVSSLDDLTSQLRETSSGIQDLRSSADAGISADVDDINTQLTTISNLNAQIKQAAATGQPTGDLEDQRNTALQDISSKMNVSYFISSTGDMQVYTASGQALVDSTVHPLSFSAASSINSSSTYDPSGGGDLSGITVNGVNVTSQITSGDIGGLLTMRDSTLPAAQDQLDQLATQLTSALNAVSNEGTAVPPPTTLTGTAAVSGSDSISPATGTVRIAVADPSGNLVSYADINLSTVSPATVDGLVAAINQSGAGVTASDASGKLVLSSGSSTNGVSINEMTSSVGSSGEGLSNYFGLNDMVTGTNASDIAVNASLLANPGLFPISTLSSATTLTVGSSVLASGSTDVVNGLYSALTGSTTFAATGGLGSTTGSFTDYAAAIVSSVAAQAATAQTTYTAKDTSQTTFASAMSSEDGVNLDQETANIATLQNQYTAASELIQAVNSMFSALITAVQSTSG